MTGIPHVSVIMPVYNGAAFIGRALKTVFAQTFREFEIVIVDDASTDDLANALVQFSDPRMRVIRHAVNRGASASRNTGIRAARGPYIAFVDCDDEWLPEKLARQHALLESSPATIAVAVTGYYLLRDRIGRLEARPLTGCDDWYMRLLAGCNISFGSCAIVRREIFDEIGFFDENMRRQEDWDWLLRYTAQRSIANVEEPLAIIHTGLQWPSVQMVERANQQIWERHAKSAGGRCAEAPRLLLSTIRYERAAALYHQRQFFAAIPAALQSLLHYPNRGLKFYSHLLRRVGDALHLRYG